MENFTYRELKLIRFAIDSEIMRREKYTNINNKTLKELDDLYDKVDDLITNMKNDSN